MSPSASERLRRHAVPLAVLAVVAATVIAVPPVVLGSLTTRTYALTAAVLLLAVGAALPYAVLVGVGTLPLRYAGVASYAAPRPPSGGSIRPAAAVGHVVAGVSYALGAAAVGAVGLGAQLSVPAGRVPGTPVRAPLFPLLGGLVVAGVFVGGQLRRYDGFRDALERRTVLGTVALGVPLALSPVVAHWTFGSAVG